MQVQSECSHYYMYSKTSDSSNLSYLQEQIQGVQSCSKKNETSEFQGRRGGCVTLINVKILEY